MEAECTHTHELHMMKMGCSTEYMEVKKIPYVVLFLIRTLLAYETVY